MAYAARDASLAPNGGSNEQRVAYHTEGRTLTGLCDLIREAAVARE